MSGDDDRHLLALAARAPAKGKRTTPQNFGEGGQLAIRCSKSQWLKALNRKEDGAQSPDLRASAGYSPKGTSLAKYAGAMKIASSLKSLVALTSFAFAGPSLAGIDTSIFTAADLDLSGSLSNAEFATTLDAGLSVKAINRRFRLADANRNASVQLNEFLIFNGIFTIGTKIDRQFYLGDASINGSLDFDEFVSISGRKAPLFTIRRNFLRADVDVNGSLTIQEYVNFRLGLTPQGERFTIFELTDFSGNGEITLSEFGNFFRQGAASAKVSAKFSRLDVDVNGVITTSEWNPGVRP